MSLLPLRSSVELQDREPRLIELDGQDAEEVFAALSSTTARTMLSALYEEPHTASELADIANTSVQNAQYHLTKFNETGLIEIVDTWYSDRGVEMKVYAPADESLVVFAGKERQTSFQKLLSRFVGAVTLLAVASLALGRILRLFGRTGEPGTGRNPGDGVTTPGIEGANNTTGPTATSQSPHTTTTDPGQAVDSAGAVLPPELLFFAGGLFILLVVAAWWYY